MLEDELNSSWQVFSACLGGVHLSLSGIQSLPECDELVVLLTPLESCSLWGSVEKTIILCADRLMAEGRSAAITRIG